MAIKAPEQTREKLLDAALSLILERGTDFTLEAVAAAAGVSKGGLLHHFASKQKLVLEVVFRQYKRVYSLLEDELRKQPPNEPGRWTRAYVEASFQPSETDMRLSVVLSSQIADYPEMHTFLEEDCRRLEQLSLEDGLPPARATLIRLACDGLWAYDFAQLSSLTPELRAELRLELLALTRVEQTR